MAFTRAKLQLCIITCFFNQEVSKELLETLSFDDEYLAKLDIRNTDWEENGVYWTGDLDINNIPSDKLEELKLNRFARLQEETKCWYNSYSLNLAKAEQKGMLIKIQPESGTSDLLEGVMDLFLLNGIPSRVF